MSARELSKAQQRAMRLAARNNGLVDTLHIAGNTGNSLYRRRLMYRHYTGGMGFEGTAFTYELTDEGWQWIRDHPEVATIRIIPHRRGYKARIYHHGQTYHAVIVQDAPGIGTMSRTRYFSSAADAEHAARALLEALGETEIQVIETEVTV